MEPIPPHLYRRAGESSGRDPGVVDRASRELTRLRSAGVRPILTLGHLAHLTGASYGYLREIVERRRDPYVEITRPKAGGGTRFISSPEPALMGVHRWVLRHGLRTVTLHPAAYAYREGHSVVKCAAQHLGARWMVKLDLHDFFSSIDEVRVFRVFKGLGYSPLVSFELARVCTRDKGSSATLRYRSTRYPAIPSYAVRTRGYVPQGAPTSGAIANAVARPLDHALADVAAELGWVYTRYSDDLTFSSSEERSRRDAVHLIRCADPVVRAQDFQIHQKKTRITPPGARQVVLGLLVDGAQLRLLPEFKRRVEVHVRGVDRFGLVHHVDHRGFRSIISFVNHIDGSLAFAQSVEPDWAEGIGAAWGAALTNSGMPSSF